MSSFIHTDVSLNKLNEVYDSTRQLKAVISSIKDEYKPSKKLSDDMYSTNESRIGESAYNAVSSAAASMYNLVKDLF